MLALLLGAAPTPPTAAPERQKSPAALLADARQALEAEDFAGAIDLYGRLRDALPASPQIPYNQGVAAYRAGDFDTAAQFFEEALSLAGDPAMQSDSAYNLGTSAYARNLRGPTDEEAAAVDPNAQLENATNELTEALRHYRRALDVNPDDADAKANAELAWRRLKRLEELQQQLQQSQPQEQDQQQEQEPQEGEQQQQQQSQNENTTDQSRAEQQQQTGADEQEQQGGEMQQPEQQTTNGEQSEEQQEGQAATERKPMSREEAEQLLQAVRDKEKQRREELARRENASRPPVEKDW
jgi:Ca-activated chloride channel family protein